MKTCFKCHRELSLSEFYPHKQMKDGHLNKCKDCARADTAAREARLSASPEWAESEKDRHRAKSERYRAEGRVVAQTSEKKNAAIRAYRQKFPEKYFAHKMVREAVKAGILIRQPCHCGNINSGAHHEDYSKPVDVIWLCSKHHAARHVEIRRQQRLSKITNKGAV